VASDSRMDSLRKAAGLPVIESPMTASPVPKRDGRGRVILLEYREDRDRRQNLQVPLSRKA
jgi:hypothetical protein